MNFPKAIQDFDRKAFGAGIAGGCLIVAAVLIVLAINTSGTAEHLQSLMTSRMIVIDKPGFPVHTNGHQDIEKVPAHEPIEPSSHGAAEKTEPAPAPKHEEYLPVKMKGLVEGLTEKGAQGMLPIIRKSDGLTPFKAYARPYKHPATLPRIALVIDGYGLKADHSEKVLALPGTVSLIISPYAAQAPQWQKAAKDAGHELWLSLPMESQSYSEIDPGPRALSGTLLLPENEIRLEGILAQADGYVGVVGFYSDRFKPVTLMMQSLFDEIFNRGLGYVELNPQPPATVADIAKRLKAPYAQGVINLMMPAFRVKRPKPWKLLKAGRWIKSRLLLWLLPTRLSLTH
ncbi:MAG: divergent polysaccharide deacetylase family protein [Alphaproteobacteria bacterium]|nr:divergent polysaccharide deacetylase family protein [Alphaproteobacteria bacterium]